ncbi:MAG: Eco57I restriction-modification methylase domain-containing protein [Thermoleophilaceae bacterium]
MNADELFDALVGVPGVKAAKADGGSLGASRLVGGVEVAHAKASAERELRKLWRDRFGGGPTPLLLVVDDPERDGALRALGPLGADDPVRVVEATDLLKVLEELAPMSRLHAVRRLAEELGRLDRTGTAGLVVKGLGTEHLYGERIRSSPRWQRLREQAPAERDTWRDVLEALGYQLERLKPRGYLARHDARPVAVVWPLADPATFSKLDEHGRPPEGVLLNECARAGAPYGILTSDARLRLFAVDSPAGSAVSSYLELDAGALAEDDAPLLALLSPEYLSEGGFAALMREAAAFGANLRDRLDRAIRQDVLPPLGKALGRWAESEGIDLAGDKARNELEAAALTFVFRALFLLYAESAGHLPVGKESYRRHSLTQIVQDADEGAASLGARSTSLWRRFALLVGALRTGDPAMSVPAYNGALFAADGFYGAQVLERASVPDSVLGPALVALGVDEEAGTGMDYSGLAVGHLGHIYEGLLSLRLSVADQPYSYDAGRDRYVPAKPADAGIAEGELLWLTDEGGRKGGGVYYTPEALVRHLVRRATLPAFERHLEDVARIAREDPDAAARALLAFRVLDPACGSAHFLVAVVDELADRAARFLAEHPLPHVQGMLDELRAGTGRSYGVGVDDAALLRRLVLKRCVYGVDISEMGAEIAKVSLWLASFVPGLSLAYLDHNVRVGNSLMGVARIGEVREPGEDGGQVNMVAEHVREAAKKGAVSAAKLVELPDRTPEEVEESAATDRTARERVRGAERMLDLWAADALGVNGARAELWELVYDIAEGKESPRSAVAENVARENLVLHWPLAFPEVFADGELGGFHAVVGNPPWEEITVEELAFYARYEPGLRALAEASRRNALAELKQRRPELEERFEEELEQAEAVRDYFRADTGYTGSAGDPDLYKFFCQRYRSLLRKDGALGVVLPRSAFLAKGSAEFREWLFGSATVERLDFLLNNRRWMFDTHPQYTVALVVARSAAPGESHDLEVAGVAASADAFARQSASSALVLAADGLGDSREVPLLPSQAAADLLPKLREGTPFVFGAGRWRCFPVRELDETNDRKLWQGATRGRQLWKGESFYRYDPRGTEARLCPASPAALKKARKPKPGGQSMLAAQVPTAQRAAAVAAETDGARVAFRDVTRATDSRTVIAALIPPRTFLTNKAPYLAFVDGDDLARACCLGLMNSLPVDWQARRFVEINLNFFILELLRLPPLDDAAYIAIAKSAARLSCVDDRFAAFAKATGTEHGPLSASERDELLIEIDAQVAHAWTLDEGELDTILGDFTLDAVPQGYRDALRARLAELRSGTAS